MWESGFHIRKHLTQFAKANFELGPILSLKVGIMRVLLDPKLIGHALIGWCKNIFIVLQFGVVLWLNVNK